MQQYFNLLFSLAVVLFGCQPSTSNEQEQHSFDRCAILSQIDTTHFSSLTKDFDTKSFINTQLIDNGFPKYVMGTSKKVNFLSDAIVLADSLRNQVNIYYKFEDSLQQSKFILYELMEHDYKNKYKQEGGVWIYIESDQLSPWSACIPDSSIIAASQKAILFKK